MEQFRVKGNGWLRIYAPVLEYANKSLRILRLSGEANSRGIHICYLHSLHLAS